MNRETQLECKPKPLLSSIIRIKNSTSKRILHTATLDEDNAGDFSALYLIFHCVNENRSYALVDNRRPETEEEKQLKTRKEKSFGIETWKNHS